VYTLDLRGHGETAGPDNLGQAGLTAWADMTADIKQLAEIARADQRAAAAGTSAVPGARETDA
jgi:alpha-beta hydrolase superfamily lysophospholipase